MNNAEMKQAIDTDWFAELGELHRNAQQRAGRPINPAVENMELWLTPLEIANYRMLYPPAKRAR